MHGQESNIPQSLITVVAPVNHQKGLSWNTPHKHVVWFFFKDKPQGQFFVVLIQCTVPKQTRFWWFLLPPHWKPWLVCRVSDLFFVLVGEHIPCHGCVDKWVAVVCIGWLWSTIWRLCVKNKKVTLSKKRV